MLLGQNICLDIFYFGHYALHDIMHVQGYNNVAGSLCLYDSILVTHHNGQFDHYHFTIFKSHNKDNSYDMLHRKYLCTFNKIIGHSNKNKQVQKQTKKKERTDKHWIRNHQLKSV